MSADHSKLVDAAALLARRAAIVGDSPDDVIYPWGPAGKGWFPILSDPYEARCAYRMARRSSPESVLSELADAYALLREDRSVVGER